ncbi:MAG: HlyD family efflux transporter periplasmic adaptor subunit [Gammaproteobacteria bacterium]|nr:HlyD family efflux transporter periplasmic adaptor subunit [Gammaproteobacteria bacterium]
MKYSGNCSVLGQDYGKIVCRDKNTSISSSVKKVIADKKVYFHKSPAAQPAQLAKPVKSSASLPPSSPPPPLPPPIYETPALLIANNKLTITSLRAAKIKSLPYTDGQYFAKDDVLVILDCKELEFDLALQQAVAKDKAANLENLKKLQNLKSTSEYSVTEAESQLDQTNKLIEKLQYQITTCVIKSNYAGKVISTNVTEGEFVSAGQAVMTVNNTQDLVIKAYVPAAWLTWLQIGTTFKLCFNKECHRGVVNRIGAEVDATSQTVDVFGKLTEINIDPNKLIAGLSGEITFDK